MKIGVDIDGVVLNTENVFRVKAELYDLLELHKNGQINNKIWAQERYDWSEEQVKNFRNKYLLESTKEASPMPGVKEIIKLLQKDGHELVIITARGGTIKEMKQAAEEKLVEYNLHFDKYYWETEDKLEICKKENIDVMIDDNINICKALSENKIRTLYFRDVNRERLEENKYLKEVNNWGEIYRYIYNLKVEEA